MHKRLKDSPFPFTLHGSYYYCHGIELLPAKGTETGAVRSAEAIPFAETLLEALHCIQPPCASSCLFFVFPR
jgi:hypothetical protein